jgi:hypothetical protein
LVDSERSDNPPQRDKLAHSDDVRHDGGMLRDSAVQVIRLTRCYGKNTSHPAQNPAYNSASNATRLDDKCVI